MDYDKFLEAVEKTITMPSFYWQSLAMLFCFAASIIFYKITHKVFSRYKNSNLSINSKFKIKYLSLLLPTFMLAFLIVGFLIFSQFYKDTVLFVTTIQLVALFLFLRFLRISLESTLIANLFGMFLVPALILNIFGLLEPTITYLDSYAVKFGTVRISIYTMIKAFITLLVVFWLSGLISRKSKLYIDKNREIKTSTKGIISKIIDILIYFTVFIIILKVFGVDMTTFALIGGAVGVGIGFGLQKIASNFISGIILLFEKSVEVGDLVDLDEGKIHGILTHFGGRYALIETFDGKEIMVPNEDFITGKVVNWTYNNSRARIEISLGISHGSDLKKAQELMVSSAKEHPRCLTYPSVECHVTEFAENGIRILLYFWVGDVIQGRMQPKGEVMTNIWRKFKENNITLQVPQREVFVKNNQDNAQF